MKKITLIFFICMVLLCGCDATYTLSVDNDFAITESLVIQKETNDLDADINKNEYVNNIITFFNDSYNYPINNLNYYTDMNYFGVKSGTKYNSASTFLSSPFCKNTNCKIENSFSIDEETNEKMYYYNVSFEFDSYMYFSAEKDSNYYIDSILLKIVFPYEVIESNADLVQGNIYTWNLNSSKEFRNLSIIYNPSKLYDSNNTNHVENNTNKVINNNNNLSNNVTNNNSSSIDINNAKNPYIVYVLLVLLVVLIISFFIVVSKKKNKK